MAVGAHDMNFNAGLLGFDAVTQTTPYAGPPITSMMKSSSNASDRENDFRSILSISPPPLRRKRNRDTIQQQQPPLAVNSGLPTSSFHFFLCGVKSGSLERYNLDSSVASESAKEKAPLETNNHEPRRPRVEMTSYPIVEPKRHVEALRNSRLQEPMTKRPKINEDLTEHQGATPANSHNRTSDEMPFTHAKPMFAPRRKKMISVPFMIDDSTSSADSASENVRVKFPSRQRNTTSISSHIAAKNLATSFLSAIDARKDAQLKQAEKLKSEYMRRKALEKKAGGRSSSKLKSPRDKGRLLVKPTKTINHPKEGKNFQRITTVAISDSSSNDDESDCIIVASGKANSDDEKSDEEENGSFSKLDTEDEASKVRGASPSKIPEDPKASMVPPVPCPSQPVMSLIVKSRLKPESMTSGSTESQVFAQSAQSLFESKKDTVIPTRSSQRPSLLSFRSLLASLNKSKSVAPTDSSINRETVANATTDEPEVKYLSQSRTTRNEISDIDRQRQSWLAKNQRCWNNLHAQIEVQKLAAQKAEAEARVGLEKQKREEGACKEQPAETASVNKLVQEHAGMARAEAEAWRKDDRERAEEVKSFTEVSVALNSLEGIKTLQAIKQTKSDHLQLVEEDENNSILHTNSINLICQNKAIEQGMPSRTSGICELSTPSSTISDEEAHISKPGLDNVIARTALGEVLSEDVKIFKWRELGGSWSQICAHFEECTGKRRAEDTLRKRYRQVKDALSSISVNREVVESAYNGDSIACETINRAVHGTWPLQLTEPHIDTSAPWLRLQVGEIRPVDIAIFRMREANVEWATVLRKFEAMTGNIREETTLRKRYKMVKEALKGHDLDTDILQAMEAGDEQAKRHINWLVHESGQTLTVATPLALQRSATNRGSDREISEPTCGTLRSSYAPTRSSKIRRFNSGDIKLLQWRKKGIQFGRIADTLKQPISTLTQRYKRVRDVIENTAGIDDQLLDEVANGDEDATRRLNELIHEIGSFDSQPKRRRRPVTERYGKISLDLDTEPGRLQKRVKAVCSRTWPRTSSTGNMKTDTCNSKLFRMGIDQIGHIPRSSSLDSPSSARDPVGRPKTSGKTMNETTLNYYLKSNAEMFEKLLEEHGGEQDREESELEQDYCHFAYSVQRRELMITRQSFQDKADGEVSDTSDEDNELEEVPWIVCGKDHDDVQSANRAAVKQIYRAENKQLRDAIMEGKQTTLVTDTDEYHLTYLKLTVPVGAVEVQVRRRMRTFQEGIKPRSKRHWLPTKCFLACERRTVYQPASEIEINCFGEPPEKSKTSMRVLDDKDTLGEDRDRNLMFVYTVLELANLRAINHWIELTFTSQSPNLNQREIERQEMRQRLLAELKDEGEVAPFYQTVRITDKDEGSSVQVEVYACDGRIGGPRNG